MSTLRLSKVGLSSGSVVQIELTSDNGIRTIHLTPLDYANALLGAVVPCKIIKGEFKTIKSAEVKKQLKKHLKKRKK